MSSQTNLRDGPATEPTEAQLRKAVQKAQDDAAEEIRINKLIEETERKIGGPVNEGGSKEENKRRLDAFVREIYKEDPKKDWPILTKAEEFIEKMKKQPFRLLHTSDDDEDDEEEVRRQRKARKDIAELVQAQKRLQAEEDLEPEQGLEPEQPTEIGQSSSSSKDQAAKTTQMSAYASHSSSSKGKQHATSATPATPTIPTSNEADAGPSRNESQPKKKRRMDNLESTLGSKWDAHVDEFGHRPARSAKK
ncbi:hypothetical protein F4820DRAFT_453716 [Hypoxylon rubiginosum]|uniref:Uncharacterized protein n=1 Tax=Hypoxylon rubiginosum TaxID=110542 RepID=A0ACB9YKD7_9PEZI|nr:hypothetical protein F4820DRAFT_453716 [Hypoxylon rubiginosum]